MGGTETGELYIEQSFTKQKQISVKWLRLGTVTVEQSDLDKLRQFTENTRWLLENIEKLRPRFHGRFVAVSGSGSEILDAPTKQELIGKILQKGRDPESCAIEFVTREPYLLIL
jgi:translation initiation factor IF-3